ncbi:MAG: contractile injection system protein, VgrG/Pvc8 family, partial [Acidimicrobiia bacterium]
MSPSHSYDFKIKIDGSALSDEVDRQMSLVAVEDSRNSPDVFMVSFMDPERRSPNFVLEKTNAKIGSEVSIEVLASESGASKKLFKGEVTAVEASYSPEGTFTAMRGQDLSHRLFRGRKTRVWKNKSYSAIAEEITKEAGLELGTIDATKPVYQHVSQFNTSDWQFLKALGAECNREVAVGFGKLEFRKPTPSSDAPAVGTLTRPGEALQLVAGRDLKVFHAGITAADQVKEVQVKGWDYKSRQPVLGTAPALTTSAQVGVKPAELAQKFGSPVFVETGSPSGIKQH